MPTHPGPTQHVRKADGVIDLSRHVSLETPDDLTLGLALGAASLEVALGAFLASQACEDDAVDQPRPAAGLGADQRRHGDAFGARGGDPHDGCVPASAPGAAFGRPQALARLVLEAEPGAQVRRRLFTTGHCSSFQAAIFSSSRSVALRDGTCTLPPMRCSSSSTSASTTASDLVTGDRC